MAYPEHPFPRRSLIKGASLGLIAGAMDQALPARAEDANPPVTDNSEIWSGEYWAKKGDVPRIRPCGTRVLHPDQDRLSRHLEPDPENGYPALDAGWKPVFRPCPKRRNEITSCGKFSD